jgi:hypothetical protein
MDYLEALARVLNADCDALLCSRAGIVNQIESSIQK